MAHDMYPPSPPLLTPDLLLRGYMSGIFPMAEQRDDPEVFWVDPKRRGILPLDGMHVSRSLRRALRRSSAQLRLDTDFAGVVAGCADRDETWINNAIFEAYLQLHDLDYAHSIELWDGTDLIGGVYGVAIGSAFFGESMFSRAPDASKIALVCLVTHLRSCGFTLFDTQFVTPHLQRLGAIEISRDDYRSRLKDALSGEATVRRQLLPETPSAFLPPADHTQ
ncbi:MAG: leucyl/phenylalanyl-tRNA--protein transferase [Pseudomonadota bacterium]